jgi:hypothetical protein
MLVWRIYRVEGRLWCSTVVNRHGELLHLMENYPSLGQMISDNLQNIVDRRNPDEIQFVLPGS